MRVSFACFTEGVSEEGVYVNKGTEYDLKLTVIQRERERERERERGRERKRGRVSEKQTVRWLIITHLKSTMIMYRNCNGKPFLISLSSSYH